MVPTPEQLRAHYFKSDREQWRFALLLWSACAVIFLVIDFALFGTASSVFGLAVPRLALVAMSVLLWAYLPRLNDARIAERWIVVWTVAISVQAQAHELIRPRDYYGHYPYQVLAALVFFAAVPLPWRKQFAVIATYFAVSMVILLAYKQPPTPEYTSSMAFALVATLVCGTLISIRMRRYRVSALAAILELEQQAQTDSLTSVPNRRAFMDRIELDVAKHMRNNKPMCILMMDIDRFKAVNDKYGHEAGDLLLRAFAARIQRSGLAFDHFARLGGEEFCFSLTATSLSAASDVAEQLRLLVADQPFDIGGQPHFVTASIGVAQVAGSGAMAEAALRRADAALYRAKENGRNRVEVDSQSPPGSTTDESVAARREYATA